jgi:hypothetical protein
MLLALTKGAKGGNSLSQFLCVTLVAGSEFSYIQCQQREAYFIQFNQNV